MRRVTYAFGLLALATAAHAQSNGSRFGVSVSGYFISDSKLRDVFGDPAVTYGVNYAALNRPSENKLTFSYNVLTATKGDSTFFLVPLTMGYETQFTDQATAKVLPYARVEGGVSYYDVAIHDNGIDQSFKAGGFVAAAEVGIIFNHTLGLKARYNLLQEKFGINLSGFQVGLTYNFGGF